MRTFPPRQRSCFNGTCRVGLAPPHLKRGRTMSIVFREPKLTYHRPLRAPAYFASPPTIPSASPRFHPDFPPIRPRFCRGFAPLLPRFCPAFHPVFRRFSRPRNSQPAASSHFPSPPHIFFLLRPFVSLRMHHFKNKANQTHRANPKSPLRIQKTFSPSPTRLFF